jgi:hypothetical protein
MSDTPETDKVWNESIKLDDASRLMEMVCHAKNLEREIYNLIDQRDLALKWVYKLKNAGTTEQP